MQDTPYHLAHEALSTEQGYSNHNLMNRSSRRACNMGVSTLQVRTRQQHTTTRCSQDCNTAQRDKRTTTATSTTSSRKHHNTCTDQINGHRVLQSNSIIHQATSNHIRQQQSRTGAWYNKGKGKKGKRKGKGKYNKSKGYGNYGNNYSHNNYKGGKSKCNQQPVGQGNSFKGQHGYGKGKAYSNKGKGKGYHNNQQGGKGAKGKQATNVCYRCGQPGHMAKQCRVAIYNCDTGTFDTNDQMNGTTRHTTTTTGTIRISHRCTNWRYHSRHR